MPPNVVRGPGSVNRKDYFDSKQGVLCFVKQAQLEAEGDEAFAIPDYEKDKAPKSPEVPEEVEEAEDDKDAEEDEGDKDTEVVEDDKEAEEVEKWAAFRNECE
jgi:hypothetical protein